MMIAALMVATLTASAQGPFIKPMAGGTLTTFTGTDVDDLKMRFGFVGGVELGYQFGKHFALTGGALYTMQGYEFEETSIDLRYNIGLSNILKERVEGDRSRFYGANIDGEIKNCVLMLTIGYKIALY